MKIKNSPLRLDITKWILFLFLIKGITSAKVVKLDVPARVRKGSEVQMLCLYDSGNQTLYSLKWFYRNHNPLNKNSDEEEFFRYTPRVKPYKQVFPMNGINVDLSKSDGGTVYIRDVSSRTSGNYKCEISVEGTFQTVAKEKLMIVEDNNTSKELYNVEEEKWWPRIKRWFFELFNMLFD